MGDQSNSLVAAILIRTHKVGASGLINKQKLILIVLFTLVLSGCGVKFWYNQLDWLVPWYIDDYVELSSQQQQQLERALMAKTKWHRSQQLPLYVAWLEQLQQDLKSGAIHQTYDTHSQTLSGFYQVLLEELAVEVAAILLEFDSQQSQELLQQLLQNDQEWAERIQARSAEEYVQHRQERIADNVSDWIGKLSKQQKAIIAEWVATTQQTATERLAYRARWREALKQQLALDYSPRKQQGLVQVFLNYRSYQSESFKQMSQHNNLLAKQYLLRLYDSLSNRQQRRLLNKLADYHEDFSDLMEDS